MKLIGIKGIKYNLKFNEFHVMHARFALKFVQKSCSQYCF